MKLDITITPKEYLTQKSIHFKEVEGGRELLIQCPFEEHEHDPQRPACYIEADSGVFYCHKCGEKGSFSELAKYFGDNIYQTKSGTFVIKPEAQIKLKNTKKISKPDVERCHQALPERIKNYLKERGVTDELINQYKLGYGKFYNKWWITIPVKDINGEFAYLKLRKDPKDQDNPDKLKSYPWGKKISIFPWEILKQENEMVVICEGEFDCLVLLTNGIPAVTSTGGAGTFKDEWLEHFKHLKKIYVCFDKDEAGEKGAGRLIKKLANILPKTAIYKTTLPDRLTDGKDVTDYFIKHNGNADELIYNLSEQVAGKEPIDTSKFKPLTSQELVEILGLTIKKDEENKLVTFLCGLSAYTENDQFNISFNAPSSTGKSYIPLEIASLFPKEDVMKLGSCSPRAFFHEQGEYNKERNEMFIDLSRKIIIFHEQPNPELLKRLRSLLSHDDKEIVSKITDKSYRGGNKTKTVIIRGFPAVIFCSAGLMIDEQESTRFLLLSPEINQEKIKEAILEKIKKETDVETYYTRLNNNPERKLFMERIEAIRDEHIESINLSSPEVVENIFLSKNLLKPRHARDAGRLMSIAKTFALLNLWFRKRENNTIIAIEDDIREAITLWEQIAESQEFNLPPYTYRIYKEVIVPAYEEKNENISTEDRLGLTRQEVMKKHYSLYESMLPDWQLRQQILPMLEAAGLITQEENSNNKRVKLIYPANIKVESSE